MSERMVLLNPGPVTLSPAVRAAMNRADLCHREPEYARLTESINRRLTSVYTTAAHRYAAVSLTGSGTCAIEAMLATLTSRHGKTLVAANGVYGQRMADMLRARRRPFELVESNWNSGIDLERVERCMRNDTTVLHVAAVHHETTTGRLNSIAELGALCRKYQRPLLLDAVSSFAAEDIRFEEWNLLALASTANKCLHGIPGLAFVIARKDALAAANTDCESIYLDLRRYYEQQYDGGYSPFTQAVQSAFALDAALDELIANGGWQQRRARYRQLGNRMRDWLARRGVTTLLPAEAYSSAMHSYRLPAGIDYEYLHSRLKESGFIIYAGQGALSREIFRLAHMGDIRDNDVDRLSAAMDAVFGVKA